MDETTLKMLKKLKKLKFYKFKNFMFTSKTRVSNNKHQLAMLRTFGMSLLQKQYDRAWKLSKKEVLTFYPGQIFSLQMNKACKFILEIWIYIAERKYFHNNMVA